MPSPEFAIFSDTPLQIFNIINIVWNDIENIKQNCDLYIHKQFSGHNDIVDKLRESELFSSVIECDMPRKSDEGRIEHSVKRTIELFSAKRSLEKWTGRKFANDEYKILMFPAATRFTVALRDLNRSAKVWFYEDGIISYYGDLNNAYGPKSKWIFKMLFKKGHSMVTPERLYVNNVDICKTLNKCETYQLPKLHDRDLLQLLGTFFGNSKLYEDKKIVFLSLPKEGLRPISRIDIDVVFERVFCIMSKYSEVTIVRPHPRERGQTYTGLNVDSGKTLWEMLCLNTINDESILVAIYSTAQLTPKILFDKEPYLLFLYKMFDLKFNANVLHEMESLIDRLKSIYKDSSKIIIPTSVDDFEHSLKQLLSRYYNPMSDGEYK